MNLFHGQYRDIMADAKRGEDPGKTEQGEYDQLRAPCGNNGGRGDGNASSEHPGGRFSLRSCPRLARDFGTIGCKELDGGGLSTTNFERG